MATLNPKEEIVFLLRGYFTCPLISFLGKRGILDKVLENEFSINDFKEVINKDMFNSIITYFESIGLLERNMSSGKYKSTQIGKKIFRRYGAFCLLRSYGNFLNLLEKMLFDDTYKGTPQVDRVENVVGSGQTNSRKYFPSAIEMLKKGNAPTTIIDIGCGNGAFLKLALNNFPDCEMVAVDVSKGALEETRKNLRPESPSDLKTILSNGRDVSKWLRKVADKGKSDKRVRLVITMWYFIHEISKKNPEEVAKFLNEIHELTPFAEIIIGEITDIAVPVLKTNKYESIMPEYLFFHEISGQGVLSWGDYHKILERIPYTLKAENFFDIVKDDEKEIPSGFIWHLVPKGG